jgi:uncharacterized protein (TIGR03437 family)
MLYRVLAGGLLAVLFATSGNAQFEIRGSRLYLDGSPFLIRGVAYSPTPIGQTAGALLDVSACLYNRDFPLVARAGANTLRLYARLRADDAAFWPALQASKLYVLAGFPLDPYYDPAATLSPATEAGRALRARIVLDFNNYAAQFQGQQRLIALVFGNEVAVNYGQKFSGPARDFYTLAQEAALAVRGTLVTTAVADTAVPGDADLPDLAFWSVNLLRGTSFAGAFEELRQKTAKPVLVAEFGVDAWDAASQSEAADAQAGALRSLTTELARETSRFDSTVLGGVWSSWTDEWWKGGADPARHGADGTAASGFPDGVRNPGWFGLWGVTTTGLPGLDTLRPRPALAALAAAWGGTLPDPWPLVQTPRVQLLAAVNGGSLPVARGGLATFFGTDLTGEADLTSACLGSLPVPLVYADTSQLNGQVPWEAPIGSVDALVYRAGVASNVARVEVRDVAPGILDRGVLEAGKPCPASVANGVRPGDYLEVYGTGLGRAGAAGTTGLVAAAASPTDLAPRAYLGSRELRVLYSGLVPGVIGLYQTNVGVPADFAPAAPTGLRLTAGGLESNSYPLAVLGEADQPGLSLGAATLSFDVQAGGPPQTRYLSIEGRNGFCEVVRFSVNGLPEGVRIAVPIGFPGERVPVTIEAAPLTRALDGLEAALVAESRAGPNPAVQLRISVLPSRGDLAFRITSGGGRAGLIAQFEMAGRTIFQVHGGGAGRGFSFVALNGDTGVLGPPRTFDTWLSEKAAEALADYLYGLPLGAVVLGAIADEGSLHLTPRARAALREVLHSQTTDALQYQDSWAIISRVGAAGAIAEGRSPDRLVVLERVLTFPAP